MMIKNKQKPRNIVDTIEKQTHKSKSYSKDITKLCSSKFATKIQGVCQSREVIFPDISLISTLFSLIQYRSSANTTHYAYQ